MLDKARTLRKAVIDGNEADVKACLDNGDIDLNAAPYPGLAHEGSFSLLQFAAYKCQTNIVELLLRHGADPEARDGFNGTALQVAVGIKGNYEVVEVLLRHGANVDAAPHWFGSALQIAVNVPGNEQTTQLLLAHGADVNCQVGRYDTALQAAARVYKNEKQLEALLEAGADATIQGGRFGTALQAAAFGGEEGAIRVLLPHSASVVNAVGGQLGTALNAAVVSENMAIIRLLLQHGADIKLLAPIPSKSSLLHFAVATGNSSVLEFLLNNGAMPHLNIKNVDGETALFRSVSSKASGDFPIAKLLLERGASADHENYAGTFPLEYAVREKDIPIAALLYRYAKESRRRLKILQWRECFGASSGACIEMTGGDDPSIGCITDYEVIEKYVNSAPWIQSIPYDKRSPKELPIGRQEPVRAIAIADSWTQRQESPERAFAFSCRWWRRTFGAWEIQTHGIPSITAICEPLAENCFLECSLSMLVLSPTDPAEISSKYPMASKHLRQERVMGVTWIMQRRDEADIDGHDSFSSKLESFVFLHTSEYPEVPPSALSLVSEFLNDIYATWSNSLSSLEQLTIKMRASVLRHGGTNLRLIRHLIIDAQLIDDVRANHKRQIGVINTFCDQYLSEPYEITYEHPREYVERTIAHIRDASRSLSQAFLQELATISDASQKAIQLEFNLTAINEAQKSTSTNRSMKRLSWTTFIFLPLLFVASLFGMNVDILATDPHWWWYIPFAFAATFTTLIIWLVFKRSERRLQYKIFEDEDDDAVM